jgi:hypothetical protein
MRRLARFLDAFANLPWWWSSVFLVVVAIGLGLYFKWKFHTIVRDAVLEAGSSLKDATATVHAVIAAARPTGPSPYDLAEDDEQFNPDLDGTEWDEDGVNFYSIDATITPVDPTATWDPTALAVVPADFEPDDPTDGCGQLGGLHSAEVFRDGMWLPLKEGDRRGPQRVRCLFAIPEGVRAVKFACFVNYFGRVELPAPVKTPARHA